MKKVKVHGRNPETGGVLERCCPDDDQTGVVVRIKCHLEPRRVSGPCD